MSNNDVSSVLTIASECYICQCGSVLTIA